MKKFILISAILLALYALFGFFVAPRLLKSKLIETIKTQTGLSASVGQVKTNPFALSVTLRDFELPDRMGERLTAFREFYINFEVSSIFRGGYVFSDIQLKDPYLRFLNRADGTANIDDITPQESDTLAAAPTREGPPATIFIDRLGIAQAVIEYEDRQRPTPFVTRLDSLDLSLLNFATRPNDEGDYQFEATTFKGESLKWRGQISLFPFRSKGHLALGGLKARTAWEYVQDQFDFEITDGLVDLQADYELDSGTEPAVFNVNNGSGSIRSLKVMDQRDSSEALQIPVLAMSGVEAHTREESLRIAKISTDSGQVFGAYMPDSTFRLASLFLPVLDTVSPSTASAAWRVVLDSLLVHDYTLVMEDRTTEPVTHLELLGTRVALTNYVYGEPGAVAQLDMTTRLKDGGQITAQGTYVPEPFDFKVDLNIDSLALVPFQPYVNRMGKLDLLSGTLTMTGSYGLHGEAMSTDFDGHVSLRGVRAVDQILSEDFLRWSRLDLNRIHYSDSPPGLSMAEIVVQRPYIRMIVGPDRTTNVQHIMSTLPDSLASDSVSQESAAAASDTAEVWPTSIGKVRIVDGILDFSDLSLRPNFSVGIQELNGAITGLSSDQIDSAVLELDGKVDQYAPVTIRGLVNPLTENSFSDITMKFQSIELTTFTPYSGKFLGYKIDKGKLHLDLHYRLTGRQLESENKIVIDQLTLGEKVESPDATSLPLKLAIALLKDSHGVIDLDIPVKGSLDDPQFSVMPIVWKVLLNLLIKAVTSPFKLLGAIFGGGDDLDLEFVNFAPGAETLAQAELVKLDTLAHALIERPGLKLDIRGAAVPDLDREVLATRAVTAQLQQADTTWTVGSLTKPQRERLFAQYQSTFNEDPYLLSPEKDEVGNKVPKEKREAAVQEAAFRRLVGAYSVSDSEFRALAQSRAAVIKDHMVATGGVEEIRIFLQDAEIEDVGVLGEVRMKLSLDAR